MTQNTECFYSDPWATLYLGDAREVLAELPEHSVDMVMTSPPYYGLRSYKAESVIWDSKPGCEHEWKEHYQPPKGGRSLPDNMPNVGSNRTQQLVENPRFGVKSNFCLKCNAWRGVLGLEPSPDLFIKHLCDIFDLVKRVLKPTGTCWVNLDDSMAANRSYQVDGTKQVKNSQPDTKQPQASEMGIPAKSLIGIPERFVLEMLRRGWIRRSTIIWYKRNVMPESVKDRFTIDFEYLYLFSLKPHYYFEQQFEPQQTCSLERLARGWHGDGERGYPGSPQNHFRNYFGKSQEEIDQIGALGRNKRCVWDVTTSGSKVDHYASYPEAFCETPIKAGCPEYICSRCGKPRVKIYKKEKPPKEVYTKTNMPQDDFVSSGAWNGGGKGFGQKLQNWLNEHPPKFTGYSDCGCGASWVSGVCLDPFMGTGTTLAVAKKLNRHSIGIDCSPAYMKIATRRLKAIEGVQVGFDNSGSKKL